MMVPGLIICHLWLHKAFCLGMVNKTKIINTRFKYLPSGVGGIHSQPATPHKRVNFRSSSFFKLRLGAFIPKSVGLSVGQSVCPPQNYKDS